MEIRGQVGPLVGIWEAAAGVLEQGDGQGRAWGLVVP